MPKRFKYYFSSQIIKDNKTGQRYYGNKPLAELLNELYEDNQMLDRLVEKRDGWNNLAHERIFELEIENKRLKAQLKDYHNAFDCSQCRYQNYDWFDDGDEFEVCDKGNNEAQMECATLGPIPLTVMSFKNISFWSLELNP